MAPSSRACSLAMRRRSSVLFISVLFFTENTDQLGLIPGLRRRLPEREMLSARVVLVAALVVAALIAINAVYVAAEFAAVSVRRSRVRQLADEGNPFATWLLPVLEKPASLDRYIAACQI